MEELQSTEILDREILEDARKKASRVLKNVEDTIRAKTAEWEENLKTTLGELEEKYSRQSKSAADEIMAHLPIDLRREKIKKIEELLSLAVKTWYSGLSRAQVLGLLKKELEKRLSASDTFATDTGMRVYIYRLEQNEAQSLLNAVLPHTSATIETIHPVSEYPGIILETKEVKIYASIAKIVDYFLGEQRAELVEALLGANHWGDEL